MRHQILKILDIADKTYYNWKKENRPIIIFLEKYFDTNDIEEFINSGKTKKLELIKDLSIGELEEKLNQSNSNALLEDYAKIGLARKIDDLFNILNVPDLTKLLPKKLFLKILMELLNENGIGPNNAKEFLIQRLKGYETSLRRAEHPNHIKILLDFVEKKLSKIEVYILIKEAEKYI